MNPLVLPRRLIEQIPGGAALVIQGRVTVAPKIDGWEWWLPTVIAGKRYDWWQHTTSGRMRLAPSALDAMLDAVQELHDTHVAPLIGHRALSYRVETP
jgi:hypothetical protein